MAFKPADAPHFFKIIQPQIVQDGRLRIPKKFVAKYGKDLPDRVYLKVPSGSKWLVNLSISNGEVWLQEGWKEFAEHYSIDLWHFLVFRYEGNSHFHVLIFDKSASEIEYPSSKSIHKERTDLNGESQLKRKGVIDEDNVKSKKTKSNSTYKEHIFEERREVTQMEESAKNASNCDQACRMKNVKSEEEPHSFDFVKEVEDGGSGSMPNTHKISRLNFPKEHKGMASEAEKERALQSAKAFTSEYPFFMATMQPSYLKYNLAVPVSFTNRYFNRKDKSSVNFTLGIKDGRTWQVNFATRARKLSKGWTTFVSDNCLGVGDVCIFELIKSNTNFLNVVIFRAIKDANC